MTVTEWYAVSIAAIAACVILYRIGSLASSLFVTNFQFLTLRNVAYPLLVRRRYFANITRLHGLAVASFVIMNGFCMGLGIRRAHLVSDLMIRSGVMASINLIPLFMGGRTNMMANFLGISLHTYYIAHHWIGRLVVILSLLHVGLVLGSGKPWTFHSSRISGITVGFGLAIREGLTI
jgi:hypothetical protein